MFRFNFNLLETVRVRARDFHDYLSNERFLKRSWKHLFQQKEILLNLCFDKPDPGSSYRGPGILVKENSPELFGTIKARVPPRLTPHRGKPMNPFLDKRRSGLRPLPAMRPAPPQPTDASALAPVTLPPGARVPVAIIVIGHNGAAFLGECLASVFAQIVTPDEILYVDDASTDASLPVARSFASRGLQIVALQENVGMNAARMAGFDRSAAPLLLFVDCDNVLPPDYLASMAAELAGRPEAAFTCPGKRFIGDPGAIAWRKKWPSDGTWTPSRPNRLQRSLGAKSPNFSEQGKWSGRPDSN